MHIDTYTRDTMEKSVCDYLGIELGDLIEVFSKAPYIGGFLDIDTFIKIIDDFIYKHKPKMQINEILFFHLSRRLILSNDDQTGYNLLDLLTTNKMISHFFKKYQIEFVKEKDYIKLYYKKEKVNFNKVSEIDGLYLKKRLGYNKEKDYCFNGFVFKDLLYKSEYARTLFDGPEFIQILSKFLKSPTLCNDYCKNSKYFCYEYCVPIEKVIFDDRENMSVQQKQMYLLEQVILRLYYYNNKSIHSEDNTIIRLQDNDIMNRNFFRNKEEINKEMLM